MERLFNNLYWKIHFAKMQQNKIMFYLTQRAKVEIQMDKTDKNT